MTTKDLLAKTGGYWLGAALLLSPLAEAEDSSSNILSEDQNKNVEELPASTSAGLEDPRLLRRIQLCGPPLAAPPDSVDRSKRNDPQTPWQLEADEISGNYLLGIYTLRGRAGLQRLDQLLHADNVELNEAEGLAIVPNQFTYSEAGLNLWGGAGRFDIHADSLEVDRTEFRLFPYHQGAARKLFSTGAEMSRIEDLRYSTCPPGEEMWLLQAGSLDINYETGLGSARHARLEVAGIPWIYTPYLQFPIDDRPRTGLLPPSFGQSESDGGYFTLPIYLRLAPNYDLTIAPTYYSRRGEKIGTEFRYLRPELEGEFTAEYMDSDDVYTEHLREQEVSDPYKPRWAVDWQHSGDLPYDIDYGIELERVSDEDYLRDFSSDLVGSSGSELESRGYAEQSIGNHSWEAEIQHWQNLRPGSDDPYRHWPAIWYEHNPGLLPGNLEYRLEAQAIQFELPDEAKEEGDAQRPTGRRYHINPRLSWPVHRQAFFIEPALSIHHSQYDTTNHLPDDHENDSPFAEGRLDRTVPIASLDAGIFLERPFFVGQRPFLQTLEPRIFYLYAPYEEQDQFPIFDTGERPNTVAQLFQENRFSGVDRIADANQITTAVTSRLLDITEGSEPFRASIGQVHYLQDRQVTLDKDQDLEELPEELSRSRSDIFADAELRLPGDLNLRAEHRYDPYRDEPVATTFSADWQYHPAPRTLLNLSYRIREEQDDDDTSIFERTQDYIEASGTLPVDVNWSLVGGWQYSRLERTNLEVVGGVEYRSCCWAVRGVSRRYRRGASGELENTIMLEFELTGLTRFGDDTESFIKDIVQDYDEAVF
ncbi:LPS-assembly protein LptD [Halorhodospira halochloris]|uniref:LPS-assembly protein LptD n=1 Tax=Halorhodospira halochloris TaxID=1052 RepID=UPI001EE93AB2|nr:LPS assembly protein LptD [Halorhodospira halochloris]